MNEISSNKNSKIFLEIEVTKKCNFSCPYCSAFTHIHGDTLSAEVKFNKYKEIVESLKDRDIDYRIMGGEPLLFPYLQDLISFIEQFKRHCTLLSNFSKRNIPLGNYDANISLHLDYYNRLPIIKENILRFLKNSSGNLIINVILPDFDDFIQSEKHKVINSFLKDIKNERIYIHPQLLFKYSDSFENFKKYQDIFSKEFPGSEFFNTFELRLNKTKSNYRQCIEHFLLSREIFCKPNIFFLNENLILSPDCNYFHFKKDLKTQNPKQDDFKILKHFCTNIQCYYDSVVFQNAKIVR